MYEIKLYYKQGQDLITKHITGFFYKENSFEQLFYK